MNNFTPQFSKIKKDLEDAAFLVTKGNAEKEAHSKIIQSLVLISQIEREIAEIHNKKDVALEDTHAPLNVSLPSAPMSSRTDNAIVQEIKKIKKRVPRWFRNPSQCNSTILNTFLELSEVHGQVTVQMLRNTCELICDFDGNYNQMKNFGEKNHGKVFDERDGVVSLWEPVKDFILELYNNQKT